MRYKIIRRVFFLLLLAILAVGGWYWELIGYGILQGVGQFRLLWNTKTPEKFIAEGNYPDSTKVLFRERLALIREIKRYAIDSLGLSPSGSYERVYDQQNRGILWAVSASEEFALRAYEWDYGWLGSMPYRGYFDSLRAYNLAADLERKGYDVQVFAPAAWSTLGWFDEPVFSSMLSWEEGDLASLIIHELTHSTVWIAGGVEFNENLADFVGDRGAEMFLRYKYGEASQQYRRFITENPDHEKFFGHILRGTQKLDSLYKTFHPSQSPMEKRRLKSALIAQIVACADTLSFNVPRKFGKRWRKKMPNNAFFMNFRLYRAKQNEFEQECQEKFGGNLRAYISYLKIKH